MITLVLMYFTGIVFFVGGFIHAKRTNWKRGKAYTFIIVGAALIIIGFKSPLSSSGAIVKSLITIEPDQVDSIVFRKKDPNDELYESIFNSKIVVTGTGDIDSICRTLRNSSSCTVMYYKIPDRIGYGEVYLKDNKVIFMEIGSSNELGRTILTLKSHKNGNGWELGHLKSVDFGKYISKINNKVRL